MGTVKDLLKTIDLSKPATKNRRARVESPEQYKFGLLKSAISHNHLAIVKHLVDQGFEVNNESCCKRAKTTPLHVAVNLGDTQMIKFLLRAGADIHATDATNSTPLYKALKAENTKLMNCLISNGADINVSGPNGCSLLYDAVKQGNVKILQNLLKKGARVDVISRVYEKTPLHVAISEGQLGIVKILLNHGAKATLNSNQGKNAMSYAVINDQLDIVKLLLDRGIDIDARDRERKTALEHAFVAQKTHIMNYLLDHGAKLDFQQGTQTALHQAATDDRIEEIEIFLNYGIDVNAKDACGRTPLHLAAKNASLMMVDLLLNNGASVQERDSLFKNSLNYAAQNRNRDAVSILTRLIDCGDYEEDSFRLHCDMAMALDTAAEFGNLMTVDFLLRKGVPVAPGSNNQRLYFHALHLAADRGNKEVVAKLLDFGADVNGKNINGRSPLHLAARNGHVRVVEYLLEKGADVKITGDSGDTVLHFAAMSGSEEIVKICLKRGCNINARDHDGRCALHYAYKHFGNFVTMALFLMDHGADFNIHDYKGASVVHLMHQRSVTSYNFLKMFAKLKSAGALISESILKLVESNEDWMAFLQVCERQLLEMKKEKIEGTGVTMHDVFQASARSRLVGFARNVNIVKAVESISSLQRRYPIFAETIKEQFAMAQERQTLLDHVKVQSLFRHVRDKDGNKLKCLPITFTDSVFDCLENEDLKSIHLL